MNRPSFLRNGLRWRTTTPGITARTRECHFLSGTADGRAGSGLGRRRRRTLLAQIGLPLLDSPHEHVAGRGAGQAVEARAPACRVQTSVEGGRRDVPVLRAPRPALSAAAGARRASHPSPQKCASRLAVSWVCGRSHSRAGERARTLHGNDVEVLGASVVRAVHHRANRQTQAHLELVAGRAGPWVGAGGGGVGPGPRLLPRHSARPRAAKIRTALGHCCDAASRRERVLVFSAWQPVRCPCACPPPQNLG